MKITIKSLSLKTFKGQKNLDINFKEITNIYGKNEAGKTTIVDAFLWLFFGKDSNDRKDFGMKPWDKYGNPSQKIDVEVSGIIDIDGKEISVRKVLHEKWVKKRGDQNMEFAGNENLYYWNDVPLQLKQYQEKISELVDENIFKLITNPLYFNSLKWQDRREILLQIAGEITNDELIALNAAFAPLALILQDKTLDEYKREVAAKKKKINDDLKAIPTRIDEISRSIPEAVDFVELRTQAKAKEREIESIDEILQDASKVSQAAYDKKLQKQSEINDLKTKAAKLKSDLRIKFSDAQNKRKENLASLESNLRLNESTIKNVEESLESINRHISESEIELENLRAEWIQENETKLIFDENQFICPSCKRPLDEKNIQETKETLTKNFNAYKANNLSRIVGKSDVIKDNLVGLRKVVEKTKVELVDLKIKYDGGKDARKEIIDENTRITANLEAEFNDELNSIQEYASLLDQIKSMEAVENEEVKPDDNSELKEKKRLIWDEMVKLMNQINNEQIIAEKKERIIELENEETKLAQSLADIEGSEYLAEQFVKAKMETLAERINGRFNYVTFKLFDKQINGGEVECCETLINGVPFSDANNAGMVNAGVDIINTLSQHYNVYAPIFIDNRESVTELLESKSQVVNLFVSPDDKKLRIA